MFTLTLFKILLFKGSSVLSPQSGIQRLKGLKFQQKPKKIIRILFTLLEKIIALQG